MKHFLLVIFMACLCGMALPLSAAVKGKIDIGPTLVNIDILESGKTEDTLHMRGVKGDLTLLVYQGLCVKPSFLFAGKKHGEISLGSLAVGYYLPINKCFTLLPVVGVSFSYLRTRISFEEQNLFHLKERFRSVSPFVGLEFSYQFTKKWTLIGVVQYAWSRTHTKISPIISNKSHSWGPNYSLGLEYTINPQWAVIFGVGYNLTLSHEKHGLRGKGAKISLARYF